MSLSTPKVHAGEDNTIKLAWIGCGGRGSGAVRQAIDGAKNAGLNPKLWAVSDAFKDRAFNAVQSVIDTHGEDVVDCPADRTFYDLDGYKKAIDCLGDGDVALLTTPQGFRPLHFEYVVNKKEMINVFCEKPLGVDIPGLKRIKAANEIAKKKGIQVGVGLNNRHYYRTADTVKAIQDGMLGDIVTLWVYRLQGPHRLSPRENWTPLQHQLRNIFCFDWTSGGFIVDALIHNIDICCWCKQDWPIKAIGYGGRLGDGNGEFRPDKDQLIDCGGIEYTFADGRRLMLQTRTQPNCWNFFEANVQGTKGCSELGEGVGEPGIYEGYDMLTPNRKLIWKSEAEANNSYQTEHDELFEAIRDNKPWNEIEYGVNATFTAILGRTAMFTGQEIFAKDVWESTKSFCPDIDNLTIDSESPCMPDANGNYWIPQPGVTKFE